MEHRGQSLSFLVFAESLRGVRYRWGSVTPAAVKPSMRGRRRGWR